MRKMRRRALVFGIVVLTSAMSIVGLGIVLSMLVLFSETGSERLLRALSSKYSATIPGSIDLEGEVRGTLGLGIRFGPVVLRDRSQRPLLEIGNVAIRPNWFALAEGRLDLPNVWVEEARLHLRADDEAGGFADLAVESVETEQDDTPFEMPFESAGHLTIVNFSITSIDRDGNVSTPLTVSRLAADLLAVQRRIALTLRGVEFEAAALGPGMGRLCLTAELKGNRLGVEKLGADHPKGKLLVSSAAFDFDTLRGEISAAASGNTRMLAPSLVGELSEDPVAFLHGAGNLDEATVFLRLTAGPEHTLSTTLAGSLFPRPDFRAAVRIDGASERGLTNGDTRVGGKGSISVVGADYPSAAIDAEFNCIACRFPLLGAVDLSLDGHVANGTGGVAGTMSASGAAIQGTLTLDGWRPNAATYRGDVPNLASLESVLDEVSDTPYLAGIGGAVTVSGRCDRGSETLVCAADIQGRRLKTARGRAGKLDASVSLSPLIPSMPFNGEVQIHRLRIDGKALGTIRVAGAGDTTQVSAEVAARLTKRQRLSTALSVRFAPELQIDIARLRASYRHLSMVLKSPAGITVGDDTVRIQGVNAEIGGGILELDGVWSTVGDIRLKASVHQVGLSHLSSLIPKQDIAGTADGVLSISGPPNRFRGELSLSLRRFLLDGTPLGDLKATASFRPGHVSGWFRNIGGIGERLEAGVAFGADIDLAAGRVAFPPGEVYLSGDAVGLDLEKLTRVVPVLDAKGEVNLHVTMRGTTKAPRLQADGSAAGLGWRGIPLGDLTAAAWAEDGNARVELDVFGGVADKVRFEATVPYRMAEHRPVWRFEETHRLRVSADNIRLGRLLGIREQLGGERENQAPSADGRLDLVAELNGTLLDPEVDIYLETDTLRFKSRRFGRASLRLSTTDRVVDLHAQVRTGTSRYANLKAEVPFSIKAAPFGVGLRPEAEHRLDFQFAGLRPELLALVAALPESLDYNLSGQISGAGRYGAFRLDGAFQGDVAYGKYEPLRIRGQVEANPERQALDLSIGSEDAPYATVALATSLPSRMTGDPKKLLGTLPLDGRLTVPSLSIDHFSGYLPSTLHKPAGRLGGEIRVSGTVGNPAVSGRLRLENGAITIAPLNQRIRDISTTLALFGRRARLKDISFKSGGGAGKGAFVLELENGVLSGKGGVRFNRFPFVRPGLPEGLINGEIKAAMVRRADKTEIDLAIKRAHVHLLKTGGVSSPKDIREGESIVFLGRAAENKPPKEDLSELLLTVDLTDPVEIRGQGVDMRWAGSVSVVSTGEGNAVSGAIDAKPGRIRLLGNVFDLESGTVTFPPSGGLDPFVNVVATARTAEALVTVTVKGRATKPDLTLSSEPPMSQYQIVALLVTGKSDTSERSGEVDVPAQAASLLLSFNNPVLERQLYQKLGVDRIAVSVGSSVAEPIVVVGKRLGRRVYIESEYHHNAPQDENRASGRIEYRLAPSWTLETEYGDAQKGEVGVFWQKRFGGDEAEEQDDVDTDR